MPKLKIAMENVSKLVTNVTKSTDQCLKKLDHVSKSTEQWVSGGTKGIQELYTYMAEKLKTKKLDYKAVSGDPLSKYSDQNVAHYLKGLQVVIAEGVKDSEEFAKLGGSLNADLSALDKPLGDAAAMIKSRKKKLLLSKKYKSKLAGYETTLVELQTKVAAAKRAVKGIPRAPSPARLRTLLGLTPDTTLKELQDASGRVVEKLEEYNSLVLKLNETANELRSKAEFAEHMRMIKEMVTEAEGLENEG